METYADIQETLQADGDMLVFPTFSILGLHSTTTILLHGHPTLASVEEQEYYFLASTLDVINNNISEGNTFITSDTIFNYYFKVVRNHIPFTDGWSKIFVILTSKIKV